MRLYLHQLSETYRASRRRVGPRVRRKMTRDLRQTLLAAGLPTETTDTIVGAVTGAKPTEWLNATETVAALQRHGINKDVRFLYRLSEKASISTERCIVTYLNKNGDSGPSGTITDPVLELTVEVGDGGTRFYLEENIS